MKAVVVNELGGPEVLSYQDWPDPVPGPGEVLVRVRASGVNFADHLMRRGAYRGEQPPLIPGLEAAGEVVALGDGAAGFVPGQPVFGWVRQSYAELAVAPADRLMPLPPGLSFEQAAAVPTVYGTAWASLVTFGRLEAGERVLVHAAGSGVGTAAIQIAKALGAWVLATAGADWKRERARELGADATLNYGTAEDLAAEIGRATGGAGIDLALEGVGRTTFAPTVKAMANLGRIVVYGSPSGARVELDTRLAIFKNLTIHGLAITSEPRAAGLLGEFRRDGLPLLAAGQIRPVIDRVLPLSRAAEAHQRLLDRGQFGKLVLVP